MITWMSESPILESRYAHYFSGNGIMDFGKFRSGTQAGSTCVFVSKMLAPGDVAHLHITSHHISSTSQKWSKSEKSKKSPNPSGIADRASGSILEPPERPKYDFWVNIWKIGEN